MSGLIQKGNKDSGPQLHHHEVKEINVRQPVCFGKIQVCATNGSVVLIYQIST